MHETALFAQLVVTAIGPFLLAALGTMIAGRAGMFIIAQEGVMTLGAVVAFLVASSANSLLGILVAAVVGGVIGMLFGLACTRLRLNQFIIGLALFFATSGIAGLLYKAHAARQTQQTLIPTLDPISVPGLHSIPIIGPAVFTQNWLVYVALVLAIVMSWFLYHTRMGLAVRGLGENPRSADSAGIGVTAGRLLASTTGMMLIAVGGAYLPLVYAGTYTEGMVAGRGWLVIALAFLGGWRPLGILAGSIFFAGMDALGLRAQAGAISIPYELLNMMPYVATLLVMVFASRWARPPQWLGRNFERGSRVD